MSYSSWTSFVASWWPSGHKCYPCCRVHSCCTPPLAQWSQFWTIYHLSRKESTTVDGIWASELVSFREGGITPLSTGARRSRSGWTAPLFPTTHRQPTWWGSGMSTPARAAGCRAFGRVFWMVRLRSSLSASLTRTSSRGLTLSSCSCSLPYCYWLGCSPWSVHLWHWAPPHSWRKSPCWPTMSSLSPLVLALT